MRYVAIFAPVPPRAERLPAGFRRLPPGGEGYSLQLPRNRRIPERLRVSRDKTKLRATYEIEDSLSGNDEHVLWLPNALFVGAPPAYVVLRTGGKSPVVFQRYPAMEVGTPLDLLAGVARGACFKQVSEFQRDRFPEFEVSSQVSQDDDPGLEVILNPWMVRLDVDEPVNGEAAALFREAMSCGGLLDLHLDAPKEEWLRLRLHLELAGCWREYGERSDAGCYPPVPELLFGDGRAGPLRTRAFFVLDALGGRWELPRRAAGWEWRSLRGVEATGAGEVAAPATDGAWEDPLIASARRAVAPTDDGPGESLGDCGTRVGRSPADVLEWLRDGADRSSPPAGVEEAERETIRNLGNRKGETPVEQLFRLHQAPLSPVRVAPPEAPGWLTPEQQRKWSEADPVDVWNPDWAQEAVRSRWPKRGVEWWTRLVQPPDGEERYLRIPDASQAWADLWKRDFFVALFRRSRKAGWRWESPPCLRPPFRLGAGVLGDDMLGYVAARPRVWPPTPLGPEWPPRIER